MVKIGRDETIHKLKKAIVAENSGTAAHRLQLFKKIVLNSRKNTIQQSDLGEPFEDVDEVGEHFAGDPPQNSVHIIVWSPVNNTHFVLTTHIR